MKKFSVVLLCLCGGLLIAPFGSIAQDAPQLVLPTGHTDRVTSVAFSPDGRYILSGSEDFTLKLWEVSTGCEVRSFHGHNHKVFSVAYSPDGRHALSGAYGIKLWDVATGQEIRSFSGYRSWITSLSFSSDGRHALSGSKDNTMRLWDVSTGREILSFLGHKDEVLSVDFSPDGRYALSGSRDKTLRIWEISTGQEIRSFSLFGHRTPVWSAAFSPDGRYVLADLNGKTLKLWSVISGRVVRSFSGNTRGTCSIAFSPDGRFAISGSWNNTSRLWEVSSGRMVCALPGHKGSVLSVAFSPDGTYVVSGSADKTLKLWDISTGREIRSFLGRTSVVKSLVFSPDGRYAASVVSGGEALRLWDASTGREIRRFTGHKGIVRSAAFSPDGRYIISGSADKTLKLWDVSTGREIRSFSGYLSGHRGPITSVAFSLDGHYVLSGSEDKTVRLWDVSTGRRIHSFSGHEGAVTSVAFSPDSNYAVSGSVRSILRLWDISSGREVRSLSGHTHNITSVAFSPCGQYILSSSSHAELKLWEVSTGREIRSFLGNAGWVTSAAFSPDGSYAVSGSQGKTISLWNVSTGERVRSLLGHIGFILSVVFSPDGDYIVSGASDGTLKFWKVTSGELLLTRVQIDLSDWVVITSDGRFDGSPDGMKLLYYAKDNKSIPLDALFDQFYTPNLVARVLSGEEIAPDAPDIRKGIEMPPVVRIISPKTGETFRERSVDVVVEAVDQGGGVEDIRLYHNGKRLEGEGRGMKKVEGERRSFTVSLVNETNTFRATAYSRDRTEARSFQITIDVNIPRATADLYIVAVGINSYKNSRYDLNYCVPDAEAVVDCLTKRGKGIFNDIRVEKALDDMATRPGIEAALTQVEQNARPEDVFVFYYSGHGVMSEGSKEKPADFYLVPTDVTQMYGNDALLAEKAISATQMREICRRIEARKQLLILDACQAGAAADTFATLGFAVRGAAEEKAIAQLARSAGVVILASTKSDQSAREFEELKHGLFTYVLLQGMKGKADGSPKDGKVTVFELKSYIDDQIEVLSKRYRGERQYPMSFTCGQDFPVTVP